MLDRLAKLREERKENDKGFTLIELLVVVVIIGILIAIAIPLYLNYQKGAKNRSASSDVRNAIATVEQCYQDGGAYPGDSAAVANGEATIHCGAAAPGGVDAKLKVSDGNDLVLKALTGGAGYVITSKAAGPGDAYYCYDSTKGGAPASVAAAKFGTTSC